MEKKQLSTGLIYALVLASGVTWGFAFLVTTSVIDVLSAVQLQATRWFCAAAFLLLICSFKKVRFDLHKKSFKFLLIAGIFEPCGYYIFETYGLKYTSASIGAIFVATIPCFVMIINSIATGRKTSTIGKLCIAIAFCGVGVCTYFSPAFSLSGNMIGYALMLCAVLSASFFTVISAHVGQEYSSLEVTTMIAIYGCLFFNILNFTVGEGFDTYRTVFTTATLAGPVLFLGIISSAICYLAYNKLIAMMNPALADNMCSSVVTITGTAAGIFIAGDPGGIYTIIGLAMTLTGVIMTSREI